jgi:hypothetical protein
VSEDKFGKPADYLTGMSFVQGVHYNVGQQVIVTTADKLFRPLSEWKRTIEKRHSWTGPVPLFLTLLLSLVTTDTKDRYGVTKDAWSAMFSLLTITAGLWMFYMLVQLLRKCASIDDVVEQIKNSQPAAETQGGVFPRLGGETRLIIEAAKYGAGEKFVDVRVALAERVEAGVLQVVADNTLAGDPCAGILKELTVSYYHDGRHLSKAVREGEVLSLP